MSRFRRDEVLIFLESGGAALARLRHRERADLSSTRQIDIELPAGTLAAGLHLLQDVLSEPAWQGTRREVIVSDRLVHYLVLERPQGLRSAAELQIAIEGRFEQMYEIVPSEWIVRYDRRAFARNLVACAMPRDLVEALESTVAKSGICSGIRPLLLFTLNRHAASLPNDCWYALAGRAQVAIAWIRAGTCRRIRVLPLEAPTANLVAELLERERIMAGEAEGNTPVFLSGLHTFIHKGGEQGADANKSDLWRSMQRPLLLEAAS